MLKKLLFACVFLSLSGCKLGKFLGIQYIVTNCEIDEIYNSNLKNTITVGDYTYDPDSGFNPRSKNVKYFTKYSDEIRVKFFRYENKQYMQVAKPFLLDGSKCDSDSSKCESFKPAKNAVEEFSIALMNKLNCSYASTSIKFIPENKEDSFEIKKWLDEDFIF